MALTPDQLRYVRDAIVKTNGIKYQDFYEEIFDHYVSSIEENMNKGLDFQEAFVKIHESFLEYEYEYHVKNIFGSTFSSTIYYGLQALEMQYLDNVQKQLNQRHWQILKNQFRWPTIVATLLLGIVCYQVAEIIHTDKRVYILLVILLSVPVMIALPVTAVSIFKYILRKRLLLNSVKGVAINTRVYLISWSVLYLPFSISRYFFDIELVMVIPTPLLACVLLWYLLVAISFVKLYREQFKIKIA